VLAACDSSSTLCVKIDRVCSRPPEGHIHTDVVLGHRSTWCSSHLLVVVVSGLRRGFLSSFKGWGGAPSKKATLFIIL